jgi:hypothetical protein
MGIITFKNGFSFDLNNVKEVRSKRITPLTGAFRNRIKCKSRNIVIYFKEPIEQYPNDKYPFTHIIATKEELIEANFPFGEIEIIVEN